MEQRSPEWFAARKGRITASNVGAILGYSPFRTAGDTLRAMVREYHGAESEFKGNIATQWGTNHEDGAIIEYELITNRKVEKCGFYTYEHWLGASPDGLIGDDGLIEVKCPFSLRNEEKPQFKTIFEQMHYFCQIQIQLFILDRQWCDFVQWCPADLKIERVQRAPEFIKTMLHELRDFFQQYQIAIQNPNEHLGDKQFSISTMDAKRLLAEYDDQCAIMEAASNRKQELLAKIVSLANNKDALICGRSLKKTQRAGAVSYAKVVKDHLPDLDLEQYRGKPSEYWVLK